MIESKAPKSPGPRIIGAEPLGFTEQGATEIGCEVQKLLAGKRGGAHLKAMRFIPSTLTELDDGKVQVIANTVVEIAGAGATRRSETIDSFVTFARTAGANELQSLSIPALERVTW
jgi:hypothetical protein